MKGFTPLNAKHLTGFTLVELMVSVFLFSILSSAAYLSLELGKRSRGAGEVEVELQQAARKAITEMSKELRETDPMTVTLYSYTDPQNGERQQAIAFASARGDSSSPVDMVDACRDGVTNNACFHVDGTGNPRWRSLIVYAPYLTADGRKELRRYVSYDSSYGSSSYFPFTFTGITTTQINVRSAGGVNLSFIRDSSGNFFIRTLMENIATEDADNDNTLDSIENDGSLSLPHDNADGVLNHGADFSLNGRVLNISLFLRKRENTVSTTDRFIISTLRSSVGLRN